MNIGPNRCSALAALAIAVALSGCANVDVESTALLFAKPMDWLGRTGGYTYSDLQQTKQQRPVTANDLVQENGACAAPPASPQLQSSSNNPGTAPIAAPDTNSLLGGGIALGMSECEVVYRAGQPGRVALGRNPNGDRTAVLTFSSGPRPGVYRFERGRLMEMDRVAQSPPAPTPQPAKKKKPAASATPQKKNGHA